MAEKTKAALEDEIQKKLLNNPMYDTLVQYFKHFAPGGKCASIYFTDDISCIICAIKYGTARLYMDVYIEKTGAINTMVFDFREIFDHVVVNDGKQDHGQGSDFESFIYDIITQSGFDGRNLCLFNGYQDQLSEDKDKEKYCALGVCLIDYEDPEFNPVTPWASVLNKILNALDVINGEKLNKLVKQDVDKAGTYYAFSYWMIMIAGYVAILGGILLIALNKSWPAFINWILGIVLILAGLLCGPNFTWFIFRHNKEYRTTTGDVLKEFIKPEKQIFNTLED